MERNEYILASEAARRLGVTPRAIRYWCQQDRIPGARLVETLGGLYWAIPEQGLSRPTRKRRREAASRN